MTVTPAKLAANRRNAQKSTGPRTAEGKKRCSRNAVTHGIFCNDLVLQGEDPKLFESFRNTLLMELSPQTIVELMICDRIVAAQWKLRRLNTVEAMTHQTNAQRTVMDHLRDSDEAAEEAPDDSDEQFMNEIEAKGRERRLKVILKLPWPMWIDELQKLMDENEEYVSPTAAISKSFLNDDGLMERLSRYEQRLELSIHRNLAKLERMRKQTQPEKKYCPFLTREAYTGPIEELMREDEAKDEDEEERTTKSTKDTRKKKNEKVDVEEYEPARTPPIAISGTSKVHGASTSDGLIREAS